MTDHYASTNPSGGGMLLLFFVGGGGGGLRELNCSEHVNIL